MIVYCKKCVMPFTKPDLILDDAGICNACRNYEKRIDVDWEKRKIEFQNIINKYKNSSQTNWDCIIPVSGGKDSTFQVLKILEFGMNPLCVNATTCDLTENGRQNIENIRKLGVDLIQISPNPIVRAKINRIGLTQVGDISWPEHVGIFTSPIRTAVQLGIKLIVWGENSQNEFGGPASAAEHNTLDRQWLEEFGGLLGLRVSDLIGFEGLSRKDLLPYFYPEYSEIEKVGVTGIFLGHYFPWDGLSNVLIAQAHGFQVSNKITLGSMVNYENLDNYQVAIHEYFKFLKFGFGRATDHACLHIRRDRLDRKMAIKIVKKTDGKFPIEYMGKSLEETLKPLKMSVEQFIKLCDQFTNKKLFQCDSDGNLIKDDFHNLTKINDDNI